MKSRLGKSVSVVCTVLLGLIVVVGILIGCSSTRSGARMDMAGLKDGEYEGVSFKFPGKMAVAVTVAGGKIAAIRVTKQAALQKYTDILEPLGQRIVEAQSVAVDDITGATISSRAMRRAVEDALLKAGARVAAEP